MKRLAIAFVLFAAACGTNNTENNGEENSLNVFANNFDACGDSDACADDEECVEFATGEQCVPTARDARILITDTSTCAADDPLPGASLLSVEAYERDGTLHGRGRVVAETPGSPIADDRGLEPDGSEFEGDACDAGFNLGCGGAVVVEIVDELGEAVTLRAGQELRVQVRADADCDGGSEDTIAATVCDDPEGVVDGDDASCVTDWPLSNTAPGAFVGELIN